MAYKGYSSEQLKKEAKKLGVSGPSAEAYAARSLSKKKRKLNQKVRGILLLYLKILPLNQLQVKKLK